MIEVKDLKKHFYSGLFHKRPVKAVDGVSFHIGKGKTFGLVGESGSGKTTVGRCLLRLIEPTSGEIYFKGKDILRLNGNLRPLRQQMQIIFQDADGSLNPRMKVIDLILEPLRVHRRLNGHARETAADLLNLVNLSPDLLDRYPHELSGGQRQRIGIARSISMGPEFVVADEAAASLDLLVQAQVTDLFKQLESERGISFLYISHDLKMIRRVAGTVAVMYLGRFVEMGKTADVYGNAGHPYTRTLLAAVTNFEPLAKTRKRMMKGELPSTLQFFSGCAFHPRCSKAKPVCRQEVPPKRLVGERHWIWCHY